MIREKLALLKKSPLAIDLAALLLSIFVVHLLFVLYVQPNVVVVLEAAEQTGVYPARNAFIIVKDVEQETTIILGVWCIILLATRYRFSDVDIHLLEADFTGSKSLSVDAGQIDARLKEATAFFPGSMLAPAAQIALDHFRATGSLDGSKDVAYDFCDLREEIIDSRLTAIRYILWAIPSIGFIGTVRGIGEALTRANEAIQGDVSGVAASLGVAFNSTFVALLVGLFLTLVANGLRGKEQERLVRCKSFISGAFLLQLKQLEPGDAEATQKLR